MAVVDLAALADCLAVVRFNLLTLCIDLLTLLVERTGLEAVHIRPRTFLEHPAAGLDY